MSKKSNYFDMKLEGEVAHIDVYGEVSSWSEETSVKGFTESLKSLGEVKEINLHINSPGGEVFEGVAIYNILKSHKASVNVVIDGLAASIASVIAMAGDTISIPSNAMLMIHNPLIGMWGNAEDLRREADVLDKVAISIRQSYLSRNLAINEDELIQLMADETWLTANEALEKGFVDAVIHKKEVKNVMNDRVKKMFNHIPENLENDDQLENDEELLDFLKTNFELVNEKLDKLLESEEGPITEEQEEQTEPLNGLGRFFF